MSDSVQDPLSVLDAFLSLSRPYRVCAVERLVGVRLTRTAKSNPYYTVCEAVVASGPVATVEVREPRRDGPSGMVLVSLRGGCATEADVARHTGLRGGVTYVPLPEAPPSLPRYVEHRRPWGDVRFGYDRERGCLRSLVLDATRRPAGPP